MEYERNKQKIIEPKNNPTSTWLLRIYVSKCCVCLHLIPLTRSYLSLHKKLRNMILHRYVSTNNQPTNNQWKIITALSRLIKNKPMWNKFRWLRQREFHWKSSGEMWKLKFAHLDGGVVEPLFTKITRCLLNEGHFRVHYATENSQKLHTNSRDFTKKFKWMLMKFTTNSLCSAN